MSTAYIAPTYPDMSRWHDPANDCPNRAAFLDQLLGRKAAAAVEPAPEPHRCKLNACGVALPGDRPANVEFCSARCRKKHEYAMKACRHARKSKLLKQPRKPKPDLLAEAMALPADAELSREHRHVLASAFVDGFAEAVGVGA